MLRGWKNKLIAKWFNSPTFPLQEGAQSAHRQDSRRRTVQMLQTIGNAKQDLLLRSFPLERGVRIVLANGVVFQVCQQEFRGAIAKVTIRLKRIQQMQQMPRLHWADTTMEKWETTSFSSMGELEQFIWTHQEEVADLISPSGDRRMRAQ